MGGGWGDCSELGIPGGAPLGALGAWAKELTQTPEVWPEYAFAQQSVSVS